MHRGTIILISAFLAAGCVEDRELDFSPQVDSTGYALLYFWDFNSTETEESLITPNNHLAEHELRFVGNFFDSASEGSDLNLRIETEPGSALRLRNPSEYLDVEFSTEGYRDIFISYALMRTNNGALQQRFAMSTDGGNNFIEAPISDLVFDVQTEWNLATVDLSALLSANDNPKVIFRILMREGNDSDSGNHRIDNLAIEGKPIS